MKLSRRKFIQTSSFLGTSLLTAKVFPQKIINHIQPESKKNFPIVISTWEHGLPASKKAYDILSNNGNVLDAVEKGINIVESDPKVHSVGLGGYPDAEGNVTLDSCIMDSNGNSGAVACLSEIKNPISVARLVKEKTSHVLLVGDGAQKFALNNGFKKENLLTPEIKMKWKQWLKSKRKMHDPVKKNHDTIGLLAMDTNGNIAGGVSTSGWAYKMPGRVGDSAIIGASLFVDNNIGAACSTGLGEKVIETVGSFLIVEKMREGYSPLEACKFAIKRLEKYDDFHSFQVSYLALNKNGEYAAFSNTNGFEYAVVNSDLSTLFKSDYLLKE